MSLTDTKKRVADVIAGVAGIGQVHARRRNLKELKDQDLLSKDGVLNVWFVSREGAKLEDVTVNQNVNTQTDMLLIDGFLAVNDADNSETTFDELVDALIVALNVDRRPASKLNGTVAAAEPPQLRMVDYRMFGMNQVLCHHAEIVLAVKRDYIQ